MKIERFFLMKMKWKVKIQLRTKMQVRLKIRPKKKVETSLTYWIQWLKVTESKPVKTNCPINSKPWPYISNWIRFGTAVTVIHCMSLVYLFVFWRYRLHQPFFYRGYPARYGMNVIGLYDKPMVKPPHSSSVFVVIRLKLF